MGGVSSLASVGDSVVLWCSMVLAQGAANASSFSVSVKVNCFLFC